MPRLIHSFASDNYAGVHPDVMSAIIACNGGHEIAYGEDTWTKELSGAIVKEFGEGSQVFPVFNGTGANVLALSSLVSRWGSVICVESAHVHCDEGGAPEKIAGIKLWTVPSGDGKLTPELLQSQIFDRDSVHRSQPCAVTISNTTELGTVYSPAEVAALARTAHSAGLLLHMDGARLSNAAAALGLPFRAFTSDVGVDLLSLGGTKIGAMGAEAVVLLPQLVGGESSDNSSSSSSSSSCSSSSSSSNGSSAIAANNSSSSAISPAVYEGIGRALPFLRKSVMQLASKQRFISAQLVAILKDNLGIKLGAHANAMAKRLEDGLKLIPGVILPNARAANAVFPILPAPVTAALLKKFRFYVWSDATGMIRLMCSWDSTEALVDDLLASVKEEMALFFAAAAPAK